ncbi:MULTISPECIES: hypothetical protein [Methylomonas]|uniref:Uncharacterized protein n=1 Tax=Methylomonas koyamae TaxID=702114 RepID=A0A177P7E9_9GAMM|nr:hypothetical protein [Methylomonas koyamae]OAI26111.1 hypothetical protein A1355_19145 [Methylomonas koyamae]
MDASLQPELVAQSTGIEWQSPYAALEWHGSRPAEVYASHVKQSTGQKRLITATSQNFGIHSRQKPALPLILRFSD